MSDIFLLEVYKNINVPATAVDLLFSLILLLNYLLFNFVINYVMKWEFMLQSSKLIYF